MKEADIQNLIRIHISEKKLGVLFRANVGEAWTGDRIQKNPDGSITIFKPRRFKTGLPPGFSDLFGVARGGQAVFVEVKSKTGRPSAAQERFIERMIQAGARAGVARSPEDAEKLFLGRNASSSHCGEVAQFTRYEQIIKMSVREMAEKIISSGITDDYCKNSCNIDELGDCKYELECCMGWLMETPTDNHHQ